MSRERERDEYRDAPAGDAPPAESAFKAFIGGISYSVDDASLKNGAPRPLGLPQPAEGG